jgi:rRNA small subunit pseudouridine methyltransferase Nep1
MSGGIEMVDPAQEAAASASTKHAAYFVLEGASLEVAKVGKNYELLNCDDHVSFLKRHGKDPAAYRPDITHQVGPHPIEPVCCFYSIHGFARGFSHVATSDPTIATPDKTYVFQARDYISSSDMPQTLIGMQTLLTVLDSPLNKAGKVKGIFVHTAKNVLIQINPQVRLPRTFRRFCGLMVQLLQKLSIRATNGPDKLLRVIKGPLGRHLPTGAHRIGFSRSAERILPMHAHPAIDRTEPLVFILGAFAHGHIDDGQVDEYISISQYPLSAAYAVARITNALEQRWEIV